MDFTIRELRQLMSYVTNDRNSTRVYDEKFKFLTKLLSKLQSKFKNLNMHIVSGSLPLLENIVAEKTLELLSHKEQNNRYCRQLKNDIELAIKSINAINVYESD